RGVSIQREDVRFILDVVGEADPWFEQGATANLFAGRFRNFVVARCRSQGLTLSTGELDLIETWFASPPGSARNDGAKEQDQPARWWDEPEPTQPAQADEAPTSYESGGAGDVTREDMPRFVRSHPRL
ncbi:MAG: NYN domain-containing protein, partial [Pseudomonadota bacterium]